MKRAFTIIIFSIACSRSRAQENFYRVYQYETPLEGHVEFNKWTTTVLNSDLPYQHFGENLSRGGLWAYSLEAEYGLMDNLSIAGYADFENVKGGRFNYTRSHVEAKYRFGQRYDYPVNVALSLEYYFPDKDYSNSNEFEARLILDKDFNDVRLVVNPILTKYVNGEEDMKWEAGVDAGVYYRRCKVFQPGIEYYQNFYEKTASIFPALNINIGNYITWNFGAGFDLGGNGDKLVVKNIMQMDIDAIRPSCLMRKHEKVRGRGNY